MYELRLSEILYSTSSAVTVATDGVVGVVDLVVGVGEGVVGAGLGVVTVGVGDVVVGDGVVGVGFGLAAVLLGLADLVVGLTVGDAVVRFTTGAADVGAADVAAIDMLAMALTRAELGVKVLGTAAIEATAATWLGERIDADPLLLLDAPQALTTTEMPTPTPIRPNERVRETLRIRDSGGRGATRPGHVVHYGRPSATVQSRVS